MNLIRDGKKLLKFVSRFFLGVFLIVQNVYANECLNPQEIRLSCGGSFEQKTGNCANLKGEAQVFLNAAISELQLLLENFPGHENPKKIFKVTEKIIFEILEFQRLSPEDFVKNRVMSSRLRGRFCLLGCLLAVSPDKKDFEKHFYTALDFVAEAFAWPNWSRARKKLLQKMRWLRLNEIKSKTFCFIKEVFTPPAVVLGFIVGIDKGGAVLNTWLKDLDDFIKLYKPEEKTPRTELGRNDKI